MRNSQIMPLMKKYLCGLAVLLLLTNCQKGSEGDSPVAPFTINLSQKMITCFPKDVKIFDFNVTGPEATNLKLEVVITEPWKYKLLKFEPSADGGYNGTIEITAPSKKSEASNYSTIDITVLSETYSSCVSASLIVNPAPPIFYLLQQISKRISRSTSWERSLSLSKAKRMLELLHINVCKISGGFI